MDSHAAVWGIWSELTRREREVSRAEIDAQHRPPPKLRTVLEVSGAAALNLSCQLAKDVKVRGPEHAVLEHTGGRS
jgi:hypothetical protein